MKKLHRMPVSRRTFIKTASVFAIGAGLGVAAEKKSISEAFDREVLAFMEPRQIPGGALAVVKDRRLIYAKAYGWADREKKVPARPDSLFRIASISKPITAAAIMQLVEKAKLKLEQPAFGLLGSDYCPSGNSPLDARIRQTTIRNLLDHTGGWDREKSLDPMFRCKTIAEKQGVPCPPKSRDVICYMLGQKLDFDPGSSYAYSNFGYCVLGRIIEKVTGLPYDRYVKENVLAPLSINRMRLGQSCESVSGEVKYYTPENGRVKSVFADATVPWPYGGFCLEAMDAHGGWLASAVDLARFASGLQDPSACPILQSSTLAAMYERPAPPVSRDPDGKPSSSYYGCGWMVRPVGSKGKANYWHNGSLPGTYTLLVRRSDGLSWTVLFNQRSEDKEQPDSAIDPAMHRAADAVVEWPTNNLFSDFA
jgi:CubicO group peptidase (beta-lactamase class C family)